MKKSFKILGICIGLLLLLVLILPLALKGKVADIVKSEGNKMLNAEFDFQSLNISLIKNFPSATISLEDFWLKGNGDFKNDTLLTAKELSATINILSLFGNSGYEISKILINDTELHAIVLDNGKVNWDIMKPSSEKMDETANAEEDNSSIRIKMENLSVQGLSLIYDDRESDMYAEMKDLYASCSGDFGSNQTLLQLEANAPTVTYRMNEVPFLNKVKIGTKMDIDADFQNGVYTFKDNVIELNAIRTNINGWIKEIDKGVDMNVQLNSNEIGFKEILSLVPAMYTNDFKDLSADGKVALRAFAKGIYQDSTRVPQFDISLDVKDANFHYPSLPNGIDKINVALSVKNPGSILDETTIQINPFNFVMSGHPFGITAELKTPVSDPDFMVTAKGNLNLGKLKDVYPMKEMSLNGQIDADMILSGRMSYIEKERYEDIKAEGQLVLQDMNLRLTDLPDTDIQHAVFSFSPQYLRLSETTVKMGKNDFTIDSQLRNYLAYAFQKKTLKGTLNITSNYLNLNDFLLAENQSDKDSNEGNKEESQTTENTNNIDSTKVDVANNQQAGLHIPNNIDFKLQTDLKQVILDKMNFKNIKGLLIVKDQKIDMSNLSMNTMGGKVITNGSYATPNNQEASLKGSFALEKLNFNQTYTELNMVQQLAPIFAGLKGSYSGNIKIDAKLDENLNVDLKSVQGSGSLSTNDMSLSNVKFINQVANIIKKPSLKDIKVKDLEIGFTINNGRVTTQPFDLKLGECTMNLSGSTGLDQSIDYTGRISLPASIGGKTGLGTVDMNIKGTFNDPQVSIDMASLAKSIAEQALGINKEEKGDNLFKKALNIFKKKK